MNSKINENTGSFAIASFIVTDDRAEQCLPGHNPCEIIVNFSGGDQLIQFWDVTDKQAPFFLSSLSYPGASYTHSGWI